MIEGRVMFFVGGEGSVIVFFSVSLGGYREDDGWNGFIGCVYVGYVFDMFLIVGVISYVMFVGGVGGWLN